MNEGQRCRQGLGLLRQGSQFWLQVEANSETLQFSCWRGKVVLQQQQKKKPQRKSKLFLPWFVAGGPDQVDFRGMKGLNSSHSTSPL